MPNIKKEKITNGHIKIKKVPDMGMYGTDVWG